MTVHDKSEVIIAPGVAEGIVALSISQVEGVAQIGSKAPSTGGLFGIRGKKSGNDDVLIMEEDGKITVDVHLRLFYGYKLQEVAANIRIAVADALLTQACIKVDKVDITVDGIIFNRV